MSVPVLVVDPRPLVREALSNLLAGHEEFEVGKPAPSLEEVFLRPLDKTLSVVLVGAPAIRQIDEQALMEGARYGKSVRILVLGDEYSEETICRLLMLGCSGYLPGEASTEILKKAILAVARGEIWAERHLVTRTLQQALAAAGIDAVLTSREREILGLVRMGHTNRQIAELLFISPETVKWHMRKVFSKIGVRDRLEATLYARENNIFPRQDRAERSLLTPARSPRTP
ncbi:MAG: response regulator transcription factor [Acidobacteria bacterium]|nr:response regulator transcription factor [Acidobacteriota bacterium]